jgi:hypothetical protein
VSECEAEAELSGVRAVKLVRTPRAQILIGGSKIDWTSVIWTKRVGHKVVFTDFSLRDGFTANSRLAKVVWVKFTDQPWVCAVLCKTSKQAVNLSAHQDGGRPSTGNPKILDTEPNVAEINVMPS